MRDTTRTSVIAAAIIGLLSTFASALPSDASDENGAVIVTAAIRGRSPVVTPLAPDLREQFADAPDGVDPIVTGPVSAAFRQRLAEARCDGATWPHIPSACYPD